MANKTDEIGNIDKSEKSGRGGYSGEVEIVCRVCKKEDRRSKEINLGSASIYCFARGGRNVNLVLTGRRTRGSGIISASGDRKKVSLIVLI